MDLGVLEGQTRGDYFLNSIFDPSVKQCTGHLKNVKGPGMSLDVQCRETPCIYPDEKLGSVPEEKKKLFG